MKIDPYDHRYDEVVTIFPDIADDSAHEGWECSYPGFFTYNAPYGKTSHSYIGYNTWQQRVSHFSSRRIMPRNQAPYIEGALVELPTGKGGPTIFSNMKLPR